MTSKSIYPPIIGDGENTIPVKKPIGIDSSYTWVTKPTPAEFGVGLVRFSDVGEDGSLWYCDGLEYILVSKAGLYSAIGYIVPSLASADAAIYSQSGKIISVDNGIAHNIPATTYNGINVYLAFTSGLATSGWFTNFQRTGANTFTCESTVSQSTSGNVASNTAQTLIPVSCELPGNALGTKRIAINTNHSNNNSAGSKATRFYANGSAIPLFLAASTTALFANINNQQWFNRADSLSKQFNTYGGASTVDTASSITFAIAISCVAANDFICLEMATMELVP